MSEPRLFAVTGAPVFHSRSPDIFTWLFKKAGIEAFYLRLSAACAGEALLTAKALGLSGLNVTAPFKSDILHFLDEIGPDESSISAVNGVMLKNGNLRGVNTDHIGVVSALRKMGVHPSGKMAAVLGAGGAARAAAYGLIRNGARGVTLINRTLRRAEEASARLGCLSASLKEAGTVIGSSDILVSCIPFSGNLIKPEWLRRGLVVLNADYRDPELQRQATARGCVTLTGLDWLVEQALPMYTLFTGVKPARDAGARLRDLISHPSNPPKPNIALVGFMGSGKTTIGKKMAGDLGWEFLDTDDLVEDMAGTTIPEIFEQQGEEVFRRAEKSVIRSFFPTSRPKVIALGGGAVLSPENRSLINKFCRTVWLWISPRTALQRIDLFSRPLLNNTNNVKMAEAILKPRIHHYAEVSDLVLSTESGLETTLARRIINEIG